MLADEEKIPHEVYNFILDRCFDACVISFNHKSLLNSERECLTTCANNFKQNPNVYQKTQQFSGFADKSESEKLFMPGMGGVKNAGNFGAGIGKLGGGMI